jgi:hypothetical protein
MRILFFFFGFVVSFLCVGLLTSPEMTFIGPKPPTIVDLFWDFIDRHYVLLSALSLQIMLSGGTLLFMQGLIEYMMNDSALEGCDKSLAIQDQPPGVRLWLRISIVSSWFVGICFAAISTASWPYFLTLFQP